MLILLLNATIIWQPAFCLILFEKSGAKLQIITETAKIIMDFSGVWEFRSLGVWTIPMGRLAHHYRVRRV